MRFGNEPGGGGRFFKIVLALCTLIGRWIGKKAENKENFVKF